jgi:hypothetical protein
MRKCVRAALAALVLVVSVDAVQAATVTETIVFLRHGEKPSGGYGQLTCQGLQRALALPNVLVSRFGKPNYIYVPNPAPKISDSAGYFYYVRPLATIEPTAIKLGLPVNAHYGYSDITSLRNALLSSTFASSKVFVVWEHAYLVKAVQSIMNLYGGGATVPAWTSGDYDSLYIVTITTNDAGQRMATFRREYEGLNGMPTTCP